MLEQKPTRQHVLFPALRRTMTVLRRSHLLAEIIHTTPVKVSFGTEIQHEGFSSARVEHHLL